MARAALKNRLADLYSNRRNWRHSVILRVCLAYILDALALLWLAVS
jgi:hypothetical protein